MNSILFYQALLKNEVMSEMHINATGGHGCAFAIGKPGLENWNDHLAQWLNSMRSLDSPE